MMRSTRRPKARVLDGASAARRVVRRPAAVLVRLPTLLTAGLAYLLVAPALPVLHPDVGSRPWWRARSASAWRWRSSPASSRRPTCASPWASSLASAQRWIVGRADTPLGVAGRGHAVRGGCLRVLPGWLFALVFDAPARGRSRCRCSSPGPTSASRSARRAARGRASRAGRPHAGPTHWASSCPRSGAGRAGWPPGRIAIPEIVFVAASRDRTSRRTGLRERAAEIGDGRRAARRRSPRRIHSRPRALSDARAHRPRLPAAQRRPCCARWRPPGPNRRVVQTSVPPRTLTVVQVVVAASTRKRSGPPSLVNGGLVRERSSQRVARRPAGRCTAVGRRARRRTASPNAIDA